MGFKSFFSPSSAKSSNGFPDVTDQMYSLPPSGAKAHQGLWEAIFEILLCIPGFKTVCVFLWNRSVTLISPTRDTLTPPIPPSFFSADMVTQVAKRCAEVYCQIISNFLKKSSPEQAWTALGSSAYKTVCTTEEALRICCNALQEAIKIVLPKLGTQIQIKGRSEQPVSSEFISAFCQSCPQLTCLHVQAPFVSENTGKADAEKLMQVCVDNHSLQSLEWHFYEKNIFDACLAKLPSILQNNPECCEIVLRSCIKGPPVTIDTDQWEQVVCEVKKQEKLKKVQFIAISTPQSATALPENICFTSS